MIHWFLDLLVNPSSRACQMPASHQPVGFQSTPAPANPGMSPFLGTRLAYNVPPPRKWRSRPRPGSLKSGSGAPALCSVANPVLARWGQPLVWLTPRRTPASGSQSADGQRLFLLLGWWSCQCLPVFLHWLHDRHQFLFLGWWPDWNWFLFLSRRPCRVRSLPATLHRLSGRLFLVTPRRLPVDLCRLPVVLHWLAGWPLPGQPLPVSLHRLPGRQLPVVLRRCSCQGPWGFPSLWFGLQKVSAIVYAAGLQEVSAFVFVTSFQWVLAYAASAGFGLQRAPTFTVGLKRVPAYVNPVLAPPRVSDFGPQGSLFPPALLVSSGSYSSPLQSTSWGSEPHLHPPSFISALSSGKQASESFWSLVQNKTNISSSESTDILTDCWSAILLWIYND